MARTMQLLKGERPNQFVQSAALPVQVPESMEDVVRRVSAHRREIIARRTATIVRKKLEKQMAALDRQEARCENEDHRFMAGDGFCCHCKFECNHDDSHALFDAELRIAPKTWIPVVRCGNCKLVLEGPVTEREAYERRPDTLW